MRTKHSEEFLLRSTLTVFQGNVCSQQRVSVIHLDEGLLSFANLRSKAAKDSINSFIVTVLFFEVFI